MAAVEQQPPADPSGRVPLHYASLFGDLAGVRQMLGVGIDVQVRDRDGQTPLHYAAQGSATAVAEVLLAHGAPTDAEDVDGNTPLWNATMRTRGEGLIVELLLSHGADPHHENQLGRTPAALAQALGGAELSGSTVR